MELFDALLPRLHPDAPIISLVGAGGKTTALYALARSASGRGMKVLLLNKSDLTEEKGQMADYLKIRPLKTPDLVLFASMEAGDSRNQVVRL